ncbi:MAG: sulfite exporter TauE/SafE family protein [Bacteroidia bacterium]
MTYVLLIIAGLFGGFLAGLLGVGGGVIFVFVLSLYFESIGIAGDELPRYLISNSIFATFFAGVSSSLKNRKLQSFHFKEVLLCAVPGAISALIITYFVTNFNWYTRQKFTLFFVFLLLFFFFRLLKKQKEPTISDLNEQVNGVGISLIGALSGVVSALSGLGGGVIMVPLLSQVLKLPIRKASSISLGVIPFFALSMSLFYGLSGEPLETVKYSLGYLVFPAAIPLALGVIIAAPFGVKTASKLPARVIKIMFATLLAVVALKMILGYIN